MDKDVQIIAECQDNMNRFPPSAFRQVRNVEEERYSTRSFSASADISLAVSMKITEAVSLG
jgi:hypothetical protein